MAARICHRCDGRTGKPATFLITLLDGTREGAAWTAWVCESCASFVGAAVDGRALFARGSDPKFSFGPGAERTPPEDWGGS